MRTRNRVKNRRFSGVLEVVAAAFILFGPSLLNAVCESWGLYAVFIAVSLCFGARLLENGEIHITVNIIMGVLLGAYALLAFVWADDMFRHIRYVFMLFTVTEAMLLAADYFTVEKEKGIGSRLVYMVIFSADICAVWNLLYWAFAAHFSLAAPFSAGIGQSDLLGIFMFTGLWCAAKIYAETKGKKPYLIIMGLPMLFVLIMSRSALTLFFGAAFAAIYLYKKNKKAMSLPFFAAAAAAGIFLVICIARLQCAPFLDGLLTAFSHPAGLGGGGFLARQTQLQSVYYQPVSQLGSGASLASSLGIFGMLTALLFVGRGIWLTFKYKSWFSAFTALLGIYAFFAPVGSSLAGLILLMCVSVYGEWRLGAKNAVKLSNAVRVIVCCVLAAAAICGCVLGAGDIFRNSGLKNMLSDERNAIEKFSTAASVNPFDGDSCYNAAYLLRFLYEEEGRKEDAVNSEYYIKRAIERDEYNALYRAEYARLMAAEGDYAAAAEQEEQAVLLAPLNDDYKVSLAAHLCRLIETYEKGSVEAQRCYQRILECADSIADLEKKKTVNDYADKAQPYTRIEFFSDDTTDETEENAE